MTASAPVEPKQKTFFGHPWGLSTLFMTEMWERFSYYGMKAILLYYMYYRVTDSGLGMDKHLATSLVSIYGAALYMANIPGGWLADRILGARRSVTLGAVLIMFAHIALSIPGGGQPALYTSMVLLVIGTGFLKPNITKNVGDLYAQGDTRRDAGFTLFVMGVQIGAFVSPIVVGWLANPQPGNPDANTFHWGFAAAAVGMAIGLVQYVVRARRTLSDVGKQVPNPLQPEHRARVVGSIIGGIVVLGLVITLLAATGNFSADGVVNAVSVLALVVPLAYFVVMLRSSTVTAQERGRVIAFIPLFVAMVAFWFIEEQQFSIYAIYADQQTALDAWGIHLIPSYAQTINPLVMLIFSPVLAAIWTKLRKQPNTPQKFSIGLVLTGIGSALLFLPWYFFGAQTLADPIWPLASLAIIAVAELFVNPVSLSVSTQLAPATFAAQVVGLQYAADSAGQGIIAQVSKLYNKETAGPFFLICGGIVALIGVALWFYAPRVHRRMVGE